MNGCTDAGCEPKRKPDVTQAMDELTSALSSLEDVYKTLQDRLVPITENVPEDGLAKEKETKHEAACNLSNQIRHIKERVLYMSGSINTQLRRLEI